MRFIAGPISLLLCLIAAAVVAAGNAASRDPLFALSYDAATARFEEAPKTLAGRCPDLVNPRWDRKLFVFAKAARPNGEYLVVGGFFVARDGGAMTADAAGAIVHLDGAKCSLAGPAREVFDYGDPAVASETLRLLAADAMTRYANAYGGKRVFLLELRRHGALPHGPHAKILSAAVAALARR
jgi:hypothetical protein